MARAKVRPTYRRPTTTKRRSGTYHPHSFPQRRSLARWAIVAGVVLVLILIFFVGPIIRDAALDLRETLVRFFGLGVLLLVAGLLGNAWLVLAKQFSRSPTFWRRWWGSLFLGLSITGFIALFRPDWHVGDVYFSDVTAGGDLGHTFMASPLGIMAWLATTFFAIALLWPRQVAWLMSHLPDLWRALVHFRLPDEMAEGLRSVAVVFLPKAEPREPELDVPLPEGWDQERPPLPLTEGGVQTEFPLPEAPPAVEEVTAAAPPDGQPATTPAGVPTATGRPAAYGWQLPLLDTLSPTVEIDIKQIDNSARAQLIEDTLASFGVDARVVQVNQGPTVTQFGIEPGWEIKTRTVMERDNKGRPVYDKDGNPRYKTEVVSRTRVRVSQITSLANDLALALAAPSIRLEAPVPGKPVVGIEVPNTAPSLVTLRSVVETPPFQRISARSHLALALGKGVSGEAVVADLARMPHLLIAGATGSGKSVCINSVIACLLMHNTPEDLRFVIIDPKRVELASFAPIPHLVFSRIVVEAEDVVATLQAVIHEMESRYRRFAAVSVRNLDGYNRSPRVSHKLPYWVVIIDELADLMIAAPYHVERQICRLAQLSRATGIHLIIATQRPSVDVVTGLIKANFPTRIAFAVSSQVDSRTILDGAG
ncbi:MAG TPA: DNA translocase FtsK, partial [Dehalococcoidia bacterium]|nr:DNA translocase FtsK [Dehalococcoidia bacterium]